MFVGTNDEDLRNELRNLGTVPIFFFKHNMLVMDAPSEITEEKHRMVLFLLYLLMILERAIEVGANKGGEAIFEGTKRGNRRVLETRKV